MLATAAKRSDRPKRQLFIDSRTEEDSLLPAQLQPLILLAPIGRRLLGGELAQTNVRKVCECRYPRRTLSVVLGTRLRSGVRRYCPIAMDRDEILAQPTTRNLGG